MCPPSQDKILSRLHLSFLSLLQDGNTWNEEIYDEAYWLFYENRLITEYHWYCLPNTFNPAELTTITIQNVYVPACFQREIENSFSWRKKLELRRSRRQRCLHVCLTAPWQLQRSLQATAARVGRVGVEGTHGLQQIENSPLSYRFVRFTRSFTSASVLRGVIVQGSRKDARMHRNWDAWRFITSVTSLNTQSEQWDPHYKWGPWQYKKKKTFALHPLARLTVINDDFTWDQSLSKMF